MKKCKGCNTEKDFICFGKGKGMKGGYLNFCKECRNEKERKKRKENPDHFNKVRDAYTKRNKERIKKASKEYYEKNKKVILEKRKPYQKTEAYKNSVKNSKLKKPEYYKMMNTKRRIRYRKRRNELEFIRKKNDLLYRLKVKFHSITTKAFMRNGYIKNGRTEDLLGCDYSFLRKHIERKFKNGMTWENHGDWHVDHITPTSSAKNESELKALCHYTNLQPLWAIENLRKSNKII